MSLVRRLITNAQKAYSTTVFQSCGIIKRRSIEKCRINDKEKHLTNTNNFFLNLDIANKW